LSINSPYKHMCLSQVGLFPDKQTAASKQQSLLTTSEKSQTQITFFNVTVKV